MNWDILESYIETLFEMVNTGDINCWDAIKKFRAFKNDIEKTTEIVYKKEKNNENVLKKALELMAESWSIMDNPNQPSEIVERFIQQAKGQVDEQV